MGEGCVSSPERRIGIELTLASRRSTVVFNRNKMVVDKGGTHNG